MKRGFFEFFDSDDSETTETPTTQASNTQAPTTSGPFDVFGNFFGNGETTPKDDRHHQNDGSTEDETTEDLDIDSNEGSGSSRYDEPTDTKSPFCEL